MKVTGRHIWAAVACLASPALAQSPEDFFRGRQISLTVAFPPGGGYDIYSRLVARHMPRFLPGNPRIVVQNMPGAGGIKAANYMAGIAPRDGSAIGMIADNSIIEEVLGTQGVAYATRDFGWIGRAVMSVNVTLVPAGSPFKSIADLRRRELIVGGTTASGFTSVIQTVANNIGGTRMKLVYGYPASPESCLAMERGELGGCTPSWTFVKTARRQWLDPANATLLLQYGVGRHPELPDLPAMTELSDAPDDRKALAVFGSASEVGRSFVAPPGVPADRLAALRAAFSAASADPEFLAEARKAGLDLDILAGEALQKLVVDLGSISPDIAERARKAHAPAN